MGLIGGLLRGDSTRSPGNDGMSEIQLRTERFLNSKLFSFLPFIILMAVSPTHAGLAVWIAFALMSAIMILQYHRHTYKPEYPRLYWLTVTFWITYLGLAIAYEITTFDESFISSVMMSALFAMCVISLLVSHPFTLQYARIMVSEEVAKTSFFMELNRFLTLVWLVIFTISASCSWVAVFVPLSRAWEIVLGWVIPTLLPIIGAFANGPLAKGYKDLYGPKKLTTVEEEAAHAETNKDVDVEV